MRDNCKDANIADMHRKTRKIGRILISGLLAITIFTGNVSATGWYNTLGTSKSLGSPLLNSDFQAKDFSPAELIIFGIFLSNYVVPFVDDYESAYTANNKGSNGLGYEVLQFGSACNDEVLHNMLDIVISNQFTSLRQIYVSSTGNGAVLGDILDKNCNILDNVVLHVLDANENNVVVYDSEDDWDRMMLDMSMAAYSTVDKSRSGIKSLLKDNIDGIESATLFFDRYGNIVVKDTQNNRYLMVIAASTNQHITRNKSYNMLTSMFMTSSLMSYISNNLYFRRGSHSATLDGIHMKKTENPFVEYGVGGYQVKGIDSSNILGGTVADRYYTAIIKKIDKSTPESIYQGLMDNDSTMSINVLLSYAHGVVVGHRYSSYQLDLGSNVLDFMYKLNGTKIALFSNEFDIVTADILSDNGNTYISKSGINTIYKYIYNIITNDTEARKVGVSRADIENKLRDGSLFGTDYNSSSTEGRKIIDSYVRYYASCNGLRQTNEELNKIVNDYIFGIDIDADLMYKALSKGEVLEKVEEVLDISAHSSGVVAEYTPYIYVTYLKWYGLTSAEYNILNTDLFDVTGSFVPDDIMNGIVGDTGDSDETAKDNVKKLLNTGSTGAEARKNMIVSTISNTLYDWYNKIVKNNDGGFLNVNSLEDNRFIGNFVGLYADAVLGFIAICLVVMVIIMIVKKRRISWLFVTLVTIVNIAVMIPSISEILPLLSQVAVEKIFQSQADEWALAESVSNRNTYDDLTSTLAIEDATAAYELINDINSIYNDKSLMIKQDISKKVTGAENTFQSELLKYKSTQWLLPRMMRQYSDESSKYVYVTYNEISSNAQKLYWNYNESARILDGGYGESRNSDSDNNVHAKVYKIDEITQLVDKLDFSQVLTILRDKNKSIDEQDTEIEGLIETVLSDNVDYVRQLKSKHADCEVLNSTYNVDGYDANNSYGYFWTTETLYTYFYSDLRDKFGNEASVEDIKNYLLGYNIDTKVNGDNGEEIKTICITGEPDNDYIDSIVDLDYVISDVIPYMYKAQLIAGGVSGDTGVFAGATLSNYNIYKDNKVSWMYRCNWVTKIVENRYLNKPGEKGIDINNYENKDIITSEYEMHEKGKSANDLSSIENKLVLINNRIYKRCILLLNSINTDGIEVSDLIKQMALIAMTEFNKGFNSAYFTVNSNKLYPTSVDLRRVSFDSIMRLVIINSTNDYSVVYGNVMKNVIENSDIISAIMILLISIICVYVIPLISDFIMMFVFILGIAAMIANVIGSVKVKAKVTMAYIMDLGMFIGINILYYLAILCLINTGNIISVSKMSLKLDTSSGAILVLLLISIAYIVVTTKCLIYMLKNWKDAGSSIISEKLNVIADNIKGAMTGIYSIGIDENEEKENRTSMKKRSRENTEKKRDGKSSKTSDEGRGRKEEANRNTSTVDTMNVDEDEEQVEEDRKRINERTKNKDKKTEGDE